MPLLNALTQTHNLSWKNSYRLFLALTMMPFLFALTGCNELENVSAKASGQDYHHKVDTVALQPQAGYHVERNFAGTVRSRQSAKLMFEVSGRVEQVFAFEGDKVTQGQILATLDQELLNIELKQLIAQQAQIHAQQVLVEANLRRINALIEQGYTSDQSKDELLAQQQVLNANQQQIQANIDAKHYQLKRTAITAPFAGTINKRLINKGELVSSQVMAFELQQVAQNELKVGVPQHLAREIESNSQHQLIINDKFVEVDKVSVNSDISPLSRTVQLRFQLPENVNVYNNQLGYLDYQQYIESAGYWVPLSAITDGVRGVWNIYTLEPTEQTLLFTLQTHTVEILYVNNDGAFIRSSLPANTNIVKSGLQRLVSGQVVRVDDSVQAP
ncbi:efflux RND transporter periplasmic adaptor subunit [Thalassotalea litorea]|uniref:Efflux RND transporter periplasmic adaptor subunit n=1 Tax=Thalassotalea litorea TaxID=2020715 RepID=A0A5R9IE34_9GAMM|nr:efflux RND transporter periplasmic adaptor subunit [Thalassotalea litorea]TLU61633.1 efflux RND transporter periplasmic adaptor subunit [Thalassotalea litorea]